METFNVFAINEKRLLFYAEAVFVCVYGVGRSCCPFLQDYILLPLYFLFVVCLEVFVCAAEMFAPEESSVNR